MTPELVRCATCGNLPTTRRPLRWDRDAPYPRAIHAWAPCDESRDPDFPSDTQYREDRSGLPVCGHGACNDLWPCPAPPDGWGMCVRCREAGPITEDERGPFGTVVPAGIETPDGEVTTTRYGSHVLSVFVHEVRCPKDVLSREARASKRTTTARPVERDEEDRAADRQTADRARADAMSTEDWVAIGDLASTWGVSVRTARTIVARLLDTGLIEARDESTGLGGTPRKVYRRCVQ